MYTDIRMNNNPNIQRINLVVRGMSEKNPAIEY